MHSTSSSACVRGLTWRGWPAAQSARSHVTSAQVPSVLSWSSHMTVVGCRQKSSVAWEDQELACSADRPGKYCLVDMEAFTPTKSVQIKSKWVCSASLSTRCATSKGRCAIAHSAQASEPCDARGTLLDLSGVMGFIASCFLALQESQKQVRGVDQGCSALVLCTAEVHVQVCDVQSLTAAACLSLGH